MLLKMLWKIGDISSIISYMLKIRLFRTGKKNQPSYRIVITEARRKRDGKYVENLGFYNPLTDPYALEYKKDRVEYWISKGAQPTETVRKLLRI